MNRPYITKHGKYFYWEEKNQEGKVIHKISINKVKKILDAYFETLELQNNTIDASQPQSRV